MSRKELLIAGLLLAVAVVGGASLPRLLASPSAPVGIALGPGPGQSVVQAPTIPGTRKSASPRHTTSQPSQGSAAAVTPVSRAAVHPAAVSSVARPKRAATQPPAAPVTTTPPPPVTSPEQPPAAAGRNASAPATPPGHEKAQRRQETTPPGQSKIPPGHEKTPPGHLSRAAHGKPTLTRNRPNLPGSGHGRPDPQAPPHPMGHHARGVGHLPAHPARAAAATPHSGPKARPEAGDPRGQGSHGSSTPQVAQGHGDNGNGKGSGD